MLEGCVTAFLCFTLDSGSFVRVLGFYQTINNSSSPLRGGNLNGLWVSLDKICPLLLVHRSFISLIHSFWGRTAFIIVALVSLMDWNFWKLFLDEPGVISLFWESFLGLPVWSANLKPLQLPLLPVSPLSVCPFSGWDPPLLCATSIWCVTTSAHCTPCSRGSHLASCSSRAPGASTAGFGHSLPHDMYTEICNRPCILVARWTWIYISMFFWNCVEI